MCYTARLWSFRCVWRGVHVWSHALYAEACIFSIILYCSKRNLRFTFLLFPLRVTIFFDSYERDIAGAQKVILSRNIDSLQRLASGKLSSFPSKCFPIFKGIHYDIVQMQFFASSNTLVQKQLTYRKET